MQKSKSSLRQRLFTAGLIIFPVIMSLVMSGGFLFYSLVGEDMLPIMRDFAVMLVAEAHEKNPVYWWTEEDISYDIIEVDEVKTNSTWLYEIVEDLLPFISYEDIRSMPKMPKEIMIESYRSVSSSLHISGWAVPSRQTLSINKWYIKSFGMEQVLRTIVHELIHNQGKVFGSGQRREVESRTVAATVETLAGVCLKGTNLSEVACQAFWEEIGSLAAMSFTTKMERHGLNEVANSIINFFFRNKVEELRAGKAARYWLRNPKGRSMILEFYGEYPWETFIIPGINGAPMRVDNTQYAWYIPAYETEYMRFDDTKEMFGMWLFLLGADDESSNSSN